MNTQEIRTIVYIATAVIAAFSSVILFIVKITKWSHGIDLKNSSLEKELADLKEKINAIDDIKRKINHIYDDIEDIKRKTTYIYDNFDEIGRKIGHIDSNMESIQFETKSKNAQLIDSNQVIELSALNLSQILNTKKNHKND